MNIHDIRKVLSEFSCNCLRGNCFKRISEYDITTARNEYFQRKGSARIVWLIEKYRSCRLSEKEVGIQGLPFSMHGKKICG